jgi:probable F420-dependent oxidoreductase
MTERDFRFGIVIGRAPNGSAWTAVAQRAEELGFDTMLVPDTTNTLAPFPALAAAAASTRTLHVGTYVLSAPNRTPGLVAWETRTLQSLTGGRFELGVGGGRPGAERDAEAVGADFGTPGERVRRVAATIAAVRELKDTEPQTPILVAAGKPRMLRLAAEQADIVALGLPPQAPEKELARVIEELRGYAGSRFDSIELQINVAAVAESADAVPEWVSQMVGGDPRAMAAANTIGFLVGTTAQVAETLRRRRAELGVSYISVNSMFMEQFAPVIAHLRGAAA